MAKPRLGATNFGTLQSDGTVETISSISVITQQADSDGNICLAYGTTVPTDGSSGYAKSCRFIKTNASSNFSGTYENIGTTTASLFSPTGVSTIANSFKTQAAWYIDPVNGNDSNSAVDSAHPIKTWAEVLSRNPSGAFNQDTTFTFLNDVPSTDLFDLSGWNVDPRYFVTFNGTPSVIASKSLTGFVARNVATNTPNQITDTTVSSWTPYIGGGYAIKMTSGTANGYMAYIAKDLGSNSARVSTFFNASTNAEATPSALDTYNIIKLTAIPASNIGTNTLGRLGKFDGIDFRASAQTPNFFASNGINFLNCRFNYLPDNAGLIRYKNCCFEDIQGYGGFALVFAGMCLGSANNTFTEIEFGQQLQASGGTLFQGIALYCINGGYVRAYDMAVFDSLLDAINLRAFGLIRAESVWGSGNAGYGINTSGTGQVALNGSPAITGTSGNVRLNTTTYTWADIIAAGYIKDASSNASISPI